MVSTPVNINAFFWWMHWRNIATSMCKYYCGHIERTKSRQSRWFLLYSPFLFLSSLGYLCSYSWFMRICITLTYALGEFSFCWTSISAKKANETTLIKSFKFLIEGRTQGKINKKRKEQYKKIIIIYFFSFIKHTFRLRPMKQIFSTFFFIICM